MGLLIIDQEKCKKDGICAGECPVAIIRLEGGDGHPALVPGGEEACLACGHCVAVCPHGALSHERVRLEDCPPIRKDLAINEEQAVQFLRSRRSIRFFKDKPVKKEAIRRLIDVARYAPTASNGQILKWLVFTDQDKIQEMAGLTVEWMRSVLEKNPSNPALSYMPLIVAAWDMGYDAVLRKAPALVVACAPKEDFNGMVDLSLSLSYLELVAQTTGLGTCWAGLLQGALLSQESIRRVIGLPEGYPHHYPMMLGYPKFNYHRLPERRAADITWM